MTKAPPIKSQTAGENICSRPSMAALRLAFLALAPALLIIVSADTDAGELFLSGRAVGINYGRLGDNIPSLSRAVELMKGLKVGYVKIYDAGSDVLKALSGSSLQAVITVPDQEISGIASDSSNADQWIQANVLPYYLSTRIFMVMVGNEILSGSQNEATWTQLVPAMENVHASLVKANVSDSIKVTTSVAMDALTWSYPPSNGTFRQDIAASVVQPMLSFLSATDSYFFLDVYPFFAWSSDPQNISLDYALFGLDTVEVQDGEFRYTNMLDAQLDAVVAAMSKLGFSDVMLAISETGWPSKGDAGQPGVDVANAARYNRRLVAKTLAYGTPRRTDTRIPTFVFSLFNEDQKTGPTTERNWGVFYPDGSPVYDIDLSGATTEYADRYTGSAVMKASATSSGTGLRNLLSRCLQPAAAISTLLVLSEFQIKFNLYH